RRRTTLAPGLSFRERRDARTFIGSFSFSVRGSPAGLGDAGQLAAVGHVAQADARQAERARVAAGPTIDDVTVAHAGGARVAGLLRQLPGGGCAIGLGQVRVPQRAPQLRTALGVPGDELAAPGVGGDLRRLGHQIFSPRARIWATTTSMPRRSMVLIPLALTRSVTVRPSDGTR